MSNTENLRFSWRCPSNIAFVKYWGKKPHQMPCNPSLSMTLTHSYTEVSLDLIKKETPNKTIDITYFFEGNHNEKFEARIIKYIKELGVEPSFLFEYELIFKSSNSFPHSAGIASSASAFGAIALTLVDALYYFEQKEIDLDFYQLASDWARRGSGSASRSIIAEYGFWGTLDGFDRSSDDYAIGIRNIHSNFKNLCDAILIVDDQPKSVSSSVGHSLMNNHPFAKERFEQAETRARELIQILKDGNYSTFIHLVESEALTLHAMMMTSNDYYLLMKSNTIEVINKIWKFREETGIPICFTLDAGPNVHVIYPENHQDSVNTFLKENFHNCVIDTIFDEIGFGPTKID